MSDEHSISRIGSRMALRKQSRRGDLKPKVTLVPIPDRVLYKFAFKQASIPDSFTLRSGVR